MPTADRRTFELFLSLVPADARVQVKPMFGQRAAFVRGNMFFGTFGSDLLVRLDEQARGDLLAAGGTPFEPMAGRPTREYVVLPAGWQRDPERLCAWVARSLAWVATLPAKVKKGAKAAQAAKVTKVTKVLKGSAGREGEDGNASAAVGDDEAGGGDPIALAALGSAGGPAAALR